MVTKVVIPVAGLGTRLLPASKSIPKEMITVVDRPAIDYVVQEAIAAGFTEIILVTRSNKECIADYFDSNFELEENLKAKGKNQTLEEIRGILPKGVTVTSVRQNEPKGLGHAILCAKSVIGKEAFAVMLPDMLIDDFDNEKKSMTSMVESYDKTGYPQIMVHEVDWDKTDQYGIIDYSGELPTGTSTGITAIVEKPHISVSPSNKAVTGRYILPNLILKHLETTEPGAGGEIQLTDAIKKTMNNLYFEAYNAQGTVYDVGSKFGYFCATIAFAQHNPSIGQQVRQFLMGAK